MPLAGDPSDLHVLHVPHLDVPVFGGGPEDTSAAAFFPEPAKIRAIVEKVGNFADLQDRQALDHGLEIGRGGVWLQLTEEQYKRLKVPRLIFSIKVWDADSRPGQLSRVR